MIAVIALAMVALAGGALFLVVTFVMRTTRERAKEIREAKSRADEAELRARSAENALSYALGALRTLSVHGEPQVSDQALIAIAQIEAYQRETEYK